MAIIKDEQQHLVLREYVIQYLPAYYEKRWPAHKNAEKPGLSEQKLKRDCENTLWDIAEYGAGDIQQSSPGLQQRPAAGEQRALLRGETGDVRVAPQQLDVRVPADDAGGAAGHVEQHGIE